MRLLIADDDAMTARAVATVLRKAGDRAEVAPDGQQALNRLSADRFDVLLCDWVMPDIDGKAVVRRLRSAKRALDDVIVDATGVLFTCGAPAGAGAPARGEAVRARLTMVDADHMAEVVAGIFAAEPSVAERTARHLPEHPVRACAAEGRGRAEPSESTP